MSDEILIRAENVSKKFCRSLKRSLYYGVRDVAAALFPRTPDGEREGRSHQLSLRKDEFLAVNNVSFELRRGECLGLIGHNGAGKSTLLKILNGLMPPDSGTITIRGRTAALIELNAGFNPILTGRENIYNEAALLGFSREETDAKFDDIVEFSEVGDFLDMPVQNYSSGMRVRLGFAVAAQMEPDVLIIDEVLAVGDVAFRFKCLNRIGELMRSAAVIFVSHAMPQIFRLCDEVIVMDHGSVTFQGRNVAEGVATYLSLFSRSTGTATGSGEVVLRDVTFSGANSTVSLGGVLKVPFGSPLRMRAKLSVIDQLKRVRVQFLLWSAEMLPVMDIMTKDLAGFDVDVPESGEIDVFAEVAQTEINGGQYTLSVIASSLDYQRTYCRYDNAAYLQVDAETASGASMIAIARWEQYV